MHFDYGQLMPKRRDLMLYRLGVRLASEVIVQTDEQQRLCEQRFNRRPVVVRSIAEPVAKPGASEKRAFVWAGRLVRYKRPLAFIDLARALPQAQFVMVGVPTPHAEADRLLAEVREAAASLPNLELLDAMSRQQLGELSGHAVAVVNTADHEGMSNVLLEAWARGVPSLALTHDPDGVIAQHALGGFAGGSPARLAQQAEGLWASRHDLGNLSDRCRNYVARHHAPSVVAAQWEAALGLSAGAEFNEPALRGTKEAACAE